jgi:hypothetical protein
MNQKTLRTQTSQLGGSKTEETKIERVTTQKRAVLQHSHSMTDDAIAMKEVFSLKKKIKIVITQSNNG